MALFPHKRGRLIFPRRGVTMKPQDAPKAFPLFGERRTTGEGDDERGPFVALSEVVFFAFSGDGRRVRGQKKGGL